MASGTKIETNCNGIHQQSIVYNTKMESVLVQIVQELMRQNNTASDVKQNNRVKGKNPRLYAQWSKAQKHSYYAVI